jgi:hypothetical protein
MCAQCYTTGAAMFGEAGVLIGGPIAYAAYRRARRVLGLRDTAAVPEMRPEPGLRRGRPRETPRITATATAGSPSSPRSRDDHQLLAAGA